MAERGSRRALLANGRPRTPGQRSTTAKATAMPAFCRPVRSGRSDGATRTCADRTARRRLDVVLPAGDREEDRDPTEQTGEHEGRDPIIVTGAAEGEDELHQ